MRGFYKQKYEFIRLYSSGKSKSGKSAISKCILEQLADKPFHCHSEVFYCAKNKGRKVRVLSPFAHI